MKKRELWVIIVAFLVMASFTFYHLILLLMLLFEHPIKDSAKITGEMTIVITGSFCVAFSIYLLFRRRHR